MNVLALCAGIGGLDLGVKLANPAARCVCYVEGEAYAAAILVKRMEEKALDEAPIWSDVRTFNGRPWRGKVDCITGGYPCQPFSTAGKRFGEQDSRHLWPHIQRIVKEVQPARCFFENVSGHLSLGFETVANDLQTMGYQVAAGLFTAEEVGASHKRERLFIMAYSNDQRLQGEIRCWQTEKERQSSGYSGKCGGSMAYTISRISERPCVDEGNGEEDTFNRELDRRSSDIPLFPPRRDEIAAWKGHYPLPVEPTVRGMADGRSDRADRLRATGNAVVPLVAAYAWRVLEDSFKV